MAAWHVSRELLVFCSAQNANFDNYHAKSVCSFQTLKALKRQLWITMNKLYTYYMRAHINLLICIEEYKVQIHAARNSFQQIICGLKKSESWNTSIFPVFTQRNVETVYFYSVQFFINSYNSLKRLWRLRCFNQNSFAPFKCHTASSSLKLLCANHLDT